MCAFSVWLNRCVYSRAGPTANFPKRHGSWKTPSVRWDIAPPSAHYLVTPFDLVHREPEVCGDTEVGEHAAFADQRECFQPKDHAAPRSTEPVCFEAAPAASDSEVEPVPQSSAEPGDAAAAETETRAGLEFRYSDLGDLVRIAVRDAEPKEATDAPSITSERRLATTL